MAGEFERLMHEAPGYGWRVGLGRSTTDGPNDRLIVQGQQKPYRRQWLFDNDLDHAASLALDWIYEQARAV